jgi:hypothetical protein
LRTGPSRTHDQCGLLCRSDSNDTIWFVALTEEPPTAITDYRFHWSLLSLHQLLPGLQAPQHSISRRTVVLGENH